MKLSQVNAGLRRAHWTMRATPVSDPLVLRLIRLLLPQSVDAPGVVGGWGVDVLSGR